MENKQIIDTNTEETKAVNTFITSAIDKGLPVETMERLFALREKVKAEYAKEQFIEAMSKFQGVCPIIEKDKAVNDKNGVLRYKYAQLDSIVEQVKKPISENNFSYDFITEDIVEGTEKFIKITCNVTHSAGHSKPSSIKIPIGAEAFMTDVQKYGARITFGKRYTFCNAFGIITGDEDVDAKEDTIQVIPKELIEKVDNAKTSEELKVIWEANKGLGKEFANIIIAQKKFIEEVAKKEHANP